MVPGATDKDALWDDSTMAAMGSKRKKSITMAISPDLDALLEFDEKARRAQLGTGCEKTATTIVPVGLPPPPRSGYPRTPTSPMVSSPLTRQVEPSEPVTDELSMPNPYINDPPPLEIVRAVFHAGGCGMNGRDEDDELPLPKTVGGAASDQLADHQGRLSANSAPPRNRVTKLLKTGKIRPGCFFDGPSSAPPQVESLWNLRERVLARGKYSKVMDSESSGMKPSATTSDGYQLVEMEGDDHRDDDRRWDIDSHDGWSRRWSESSGVSPSSASLAPSSSGHISISSTFYSDSDMSHSSPHLRSTSRESFMDVRPPPPPQVPLLVDRDRSVSQSSSPTSSPKPPIPTTPKPIFRNPSLKTSPAQHHTEPKIPTGSPKTGNFLDLDERSDLIRKNKKLVRLFGQSPGPDALLHQDLGRSNKAHVSPNLTDHRRIHTALSASNKLEISVIQRASTYPYTHDRRHSAPLSPDEVSILSSPINRKSTDYSLDSHYASSVSSFMDLSDDLGSASPKVAGNVPGRPHSPSQQSVFENMSPEEQAEELRRRKREKLAKLHRFLGSQVPVHLALGLGNPETSLPPLKTDVIPDSRDDRKVIVRRRRCSSVESYPLGWSDEHDRIRQDLNVKEKAINVRRAQKMEKVHIYCPFLFIWLSTFPQVFGVAPPQTLYHTRSSPSPSLVHAGAVANSKFVSGWISSGENLSPMTGQRNLNQSSYVKAKKKKDQRPSTSDSSKQLLPEHPREWGDLPILKKRPSIVYSHYHSSLNNLNDLMDKVTAFHSYGSS